MTKNVYKKKSRLLYYVIALVISFVLALAFTLFFSLLFGYKYRIVTTDSMESTIHVNSLIIEGSKKYENIKVGDIITFTDTTSSAKDATITHRVIEINTDNSLTTKGDNNDYQDALHVTKSNYLSTTVIIIPGVGDFIDYLFAHVFELAFCVVVFIIAYNVLG